MRTHRLIVYAFVAGLVSLLAGTAMAANTNTSLKGTYRHSTITTCAEIEATGTGFTPAPTFFATGPGERTIINSTGLITYDGIGGATETTEGILFFSGPFASGSPTIITTTENCTWTYTVNPDGSFSRTNGSCTGIDTNHPAGNTPSPTYTLIGSTINGQIGATGSVLIMNQVAPVEDTLVVSLGGTPFYSAKRICGYQGTAVRVK